MRRFAVDLLLFAFLVAGCIEVSRAEDPRFCGPPERHADGTIKRSASVLREFERLWPKPQDGRAWYRDHVIPLSCGGCDSIFNLQWLHEQAWRDKSRWERSAYGGRGMSEGCP